MPGGGPRKLRPAKGERMRVGKVRRRWHGVAWQRQPCGCVLRRQLREGSGRAPPPPPHSWRARLGCLSSLCLFSFFAFFSPPSAFRFFCRARACGS